MSILWKIGAALAALAIAITATLQYRQSLISDGVKIESDRRDGLAKMALIESNKKVAAKQEEIAALQLTLSNLQTENQNAQSASLVTESALRAGTERLRAEFITYRISEAGQIAGSAAPTVDYGTTFTADLEPGVAANLTELASRGDQAIRRLNACILAYGEIKKANDE